MKHIILVSSAGVSKGGGVSLLDMFGGEEGRRKDPKREEAVTAAAVAAKIPLTIARPGTVKASVGGKKPLVFSQGGEGGGGAVSLEDAAEVVVRCLGAPPPPGEVTAFDFRNGAGDGGGKRDWRALFGGLSRN